MNTTKEWNEKYETVKHLLVAPMNYAEVFEKNEIHGKKLFVLEMGEIIFPTGELLVRDPLVWLSRAEKPYLTKVPRGKYSIETLVAEIEEEHYRYVLTRVKFNENKPVIYYEALKGDENLEGVDNESIFGFMVDAGLATIVDVETRDKYCDFVEKWYKENTEKNIYNDFFAKEFKENAMKNPKFQREDGDWINFKIPNTDLSIPMIQSGFGDGLYPVYFGYDEKGNLCDIVLEYIPIN
ncbi:DUF4241 domain-containing protein [uncultured Granulicatella sp.]|uniref:DUF4241 domain-containing protein n=1 Tax=uncultured Granulicatella sp. TaxID=316089 RepID=UPI0028D093D0|nr:DUF4241 domain-containing protein [uncultured Granulicatella sp.]